MDLYVWKVEYDVHVRAVRPMEGCEKATRPADFWVYSQRAHVACGPYLENLMWAVHDGGAAQVGKAWDDEESGWVLTRSACRVLSAERLMRLDSVRGGGPDHEGEVSS